MNIFSIRRKLVLLVVVVILVASWGTASAASLSRGTPQSESLALESLDRIWRIVQGVLGKIGCHIDPNGRCINQAPAPQEKEGCHIDPSGRCLV